jgi:acetolactate synthase-1/2/3 large subunit
VAGGHAAQNLAINQNLSMNRTTAMTMRTGGQIIIDCLEAQGVDRIFCVPGESYLPVLDALHDTTIQTIVTRHEGAAAIMAEADAKLTRRPGLCMVTRGPGATNAALGIHIARQDSTPLVMLVGQIASSMRGRDAFQEVDYRQTFGDLAKWADEIDSADRVPEMLNRAFHVALSGRPGPVVLAMPEDMLAATTAARPGPLVNVTAPSPNADQVARFIAMMEAAKDPIVVAGGSQWTEDDVTALHALSERFDVPVSCSFRRQHLFDHMHPNYAGDAGLGINPKLVSRLKDADLVVLLGGRFSEVPSQDYTLLGIPQAKQKLVHVHACSNELGRVYAADLAIQSGAGAFVSAVLTATLDEPRDNPKRGPAAHAEYRIWTDTPKPSPGKVELGGIMTRLRQIAADDALMVNGSGNSSVWVHRYWRYRQHNSQLAATAGSMGYGLPSAIAGKLRESHRQVICLVGDGCFQMTMQDFATAVQYDVPIIVIIADNGMHGTIRMHQERHFPGRVVATDITNPDFEMFAQSCGGFGATVTSNEQFAGAFTEAVASGKPAIINLKLDPQALTPMKTLDEIRDDALAARR